MNYSKVKSVMIVFLIIVNLAFLTYIVYEKNQTDRQNRQMAQTTAELLSSRGITADAEMIAECAKSESSQNVYVDNVISSYADFSEKILGNCEKNSDSEFSSGKGKVSFSGDRFFAKASENNHLLDAGISERNAEKTVSDYLMSLGIDTDGAVTEQTNVDGKINIKFSKKIYSLPLFQTGISVTADKSGISEISGNWYNLSEQNVSAAPLKSISGVLVEYMNKKQGQTGIKIEEISLCYSALDPDAYHESIFLTPYWRITSSDGDCYIDARENN